MAKTAKAAATAVPAPISLPPKLTTASPTASPTAAPTRAPTRRALTRSPTPLATAKRCTPSAHADDDGVNVDECGCGVRQGWSLAHGSCCQGAETTHAEAECCAAGGRPQRALRAFAPAVAGSAFDCLKSINFLAKKHGSTASAQRGAAKSNLGTSDLGGWLLAEARHFESSHPGGVLAWGAGVAAILLLGTCSIASVVRRASPRKRAQQVLVADEEEEAVPLYAGTDASYGQVSHVQPRQARNFAHTRLPSQGITSHAAVTSMNGLVDVTVGSPGQLMQLQDSDV